MAKREEIVGEIVNLDYREFTDTIFRNCKLVYKGGRPPKMMNVDMVESEFIFEGPAINTLHMMRLIAHSGDAKMVVKDMLGLDDWEPAYASEG